MKGCERQKRAWGTGGEGGGGGHGCMDGAKGK